MARLRSVLIDNTIGRIFRNTVSVGAATAANLIAGNKLESLSIAAAKKTIVRPTINIGKGTGMYFAGGALVNALQLTAATAPVGGPIVLSVRLGISHEDSVELGTYDLPDLLKSVTYSVTIAVPVEQSLYFDIIQAGAVKPGIGFGVRATFFRG